jgi:hypothetical protein
VIIETGHAPKCTSPSPLVRLHRLMTDYQTLPSSVTEHSTYSWKSIAEPFHAPAVETLVKTLASEQKAHSNTLQILNQAENQIAILNAKVARREVELESHNFILDDFHSSRPSDQRKHVDGASRNIHGHVKITQAEALSALQATAQRNRALEQEITTLAGRVCVIQHLLLFE